MTDFAVRTAHAGDATAVATLKCVATTSSRAVSAADAERYATLIGDPTSVVLLAETDGGPVGFLAMRCAAHAAVESRNPVQLWQIYVAPLHHGSGAAARLMDRAIDEVRKRGHNVAWLGVSEGNARAIAFYRRHGFRSIGVHAVGTGEHAHSDLVMLRGLD